MQREQPLTYRHSQCLFELVGMVLAEASTRWERHMTKTRLLCACAVSAMAIAAASPAMAQSAPDDAIDATKDIVITGSIIKGTPEDAALPVNVISGADLENRGSPSAVELLKALPTSSAVLGDANQFDSRSQGAEGIATANLRGLSPQRTLVLPNNRRLVTAGNGVPSVDINLIPAAAIGRIEVLKDGGATTYGSDAIAGVVNFITRTDQEGFRSRRTIASSRIRTAISTPRSAMAMSARVSASWSPPASSARPVAGA